MPIPNRHQHHPQLPPSPKAESSQQRLLIKGGRVANDDGTILADVFIEEGLIKQIGLNLIIPGGTKIIDASGKFVMPGGIDTDTQLECSVMGTRSIDDFFTGTRAAVTGGTTMILDLVIPSKEQSLIEAFEQCRERADSKVCCDYGLHVAITHWNQQVTKEMETLVKEKGVTSFQVFMSYHDGAILKDDELFQIFSKCRELGVLAMVHAENGLVVKELEKEMSQLGITGPEGYLLSRPEKLEGETVHRAVTIAEQARCPLYVVRVLNKSVADQIRQARLNGQLIYGEAIAASFISDGPHYFDKSWRNAAACVMSPPLRGDPKTASHLVDHLASGSLSTTGTAHCTFNANQKALGKDDFRKIPNGLNGIEERLSVLWTKCVETGKLDVNQFVAITSSNAARLFNIYPRKGRIAVGSDADCIVWDPQGKKLISAATHHQASDFNIFEGLFCHGTVALTIVAGKIVYDDEQLQVVQGSGNYIETKPFNEYIYQKLGKREHLREQLLAKYKVEREPYAGEVIEISKPIPTNNDEINKTKIQPSRPPSRDSSATGFHNRPTTRAGVRNLFDSSFMLSGEQWDDGAPRKPSRFHQPPGGASKGLW